MFPPFDEINAVFDGGMTHENTGEKNESVDKDEKRCCWHIPIGGLNCECCALYYYYYYYYYYY